MRSLMGPDCALSTNLRQTRGFGFLSWCLTSSFHRPPRAVRSLGEVLTHQETANSRQNALAYARALAMEIG